MDADADSKCYPTHIFEITRQIKVYFGLSEEAITSQNQRFSISLFRG